VHVTVLQDSYKLYEVKLECFVVIQLLRTESRRFRNADIACKATNRKQAEREKEANAEDAVFSKVRM
jgi:hypothetical protein